MDKARVAEILSEIATLLEIKGENPFKSRAYSSAARTLELMTDDLAVLVQEKRLSEINGIGEALRDKIAELVTTGRLDYYETLKASIEPGLLEMLRIPGLGPKRIRTLHEKLGIDSIEALEAACKANKVSELSGFGVKTEANLLAGIDQHRSYQNQHRYADVISRAEGLVDALREHPDVHRVCIAGSLRRGKEVIKDVDLLASSGNPKSVMDYFVSFPGIERVTNHGETKSSVLLESGIQCDLRVVPDAQFASALHHFTGSKEHNVAMRQRAISQGLKMSEWGLFDSEGKPLSCRTEAELFSHLGLDEIPPELREAMGELEAAENHKLPRLVEWTDLRGCFHNHTNASDGTNTLEEMMHAAESIGLDYLGIADHSKSSFQANGLSEDRLLQQIEEIKKINQLGFHVTVLSGVECDILKDGTLDFDDELLAQLDYVVASVHSSFQLDEEAMTQRIIRAMESPYVNMIGHLTGRLLLQRPAYAVNVSKIIDAAVSTGTWIELNANPWRLDMDWRWWKAARDKGVKCVINPDAHSVGQLGYLKIGINSARKGWLRKEDVINTQSLDHIKELLSK